MPEQPPTNGQPAAPVAPVAPAAPQPGVAASVAQPLMTAAKAWSVGKDLLTLAVIPLLMWGVKLEVGNAERNLHISQLQTQNAELKDELRAEIKEAKGIDTEVRQNTIKLAVLEGKLDTANGRLGEIINLLQKD